MNTFGLAMYVLTMHSYVEPLHKMLLIGKIKERLGCFYSVQRVTNLTNFQTIYCWATAVRLEAKPFYEIEALKL